VLDPEKVKMNKFGCYCNKGCKDLYKKKNNVDEKLVYNKFNNFNCARIDE
jgi:hypothetical protein